MKETNEFYNIGSLDKNDPYIFDPVSLKVGTSTLKGKLIWNYCTPPKTPEGCNDSYDSIGFFISGTTCFALSKSRGAGGSTSWTYDVLNSNTNSSSGLTFTDGYSVKGANQGIDLADIYPADIKFEIGCNKDGTSTSSPIVIQNPTDFTLSITVTSITGCGKDRTGPFGNLGALLPYIHIAGMIIGLILCFFGERVFKPGVGITAFAVGSIFCYSFFDIVWSGLNPNIKLYLIFGFSLVIGLFFGYFVYKVEFVAYVISGLIVGSVIGAFLFILFRVNHLQVGSGNLNFYAFNITISSLFGMLSFFLRSYPFF